MGTFQRNREHWEQWHIEGAKYKHCNSKDLYFTNKINTSLFSTSDNFLFLLASTPFGF